jgi:hypothetical protein
MKYFFKTFFLIFLKSSETTNVHDYMSMPNDRSNTNEAPSQNILLPAEQQQQLQFLNNQEIVQYVFSQPDLITQIVRQFNELNLTYPTVASQQQQFYEIETHKIETCDKEISIPTEKELSVTETSTDYFESSPSSIHSVRLVRVSTFISLHCKNRDGRRLFAFFQYRKPTNSLVLESTPPYCTELVGLTLTTNPEYDNNQSIFFFS